MAGRSEVVIKRAEDLAREAWDDPVRGSVSWFTLFSSDRTPTDSLCAGVAEIEPGGGSRRTHRHEQPELYFITEGTGILMVGDREITVSRGSAVFIPGNVEHGLRNASERIVRLLYVFPTGDFGDVVYRFGDEDEGVGSPQPP
jgi:mannose-6-phosphate isomerase-like protein (cupin superfamily)